MNTSSLDLPSPAAASTAEARSSPTFRIRPFDGPLGAEVLGLDLSQPLSDRDFARIHRAHLDYHVLVFRDQHITPAQQVAFTQRWGSLQRHVLHQFALPGHPEVLIVSNIVENGQPIGLGDAGVFWHSDLSYKERPSLGSFLHAQELPADGGDTLFANQHLAWAALPADLRATVQNRRAEHSYLKQYEALRQRNPWRPPLTEAQVRQVPAVWQPIQRRHPETSVPALFVSEHFTTRIEGLPDDESQAVLDELFALQTQDRFIYRHRWAPHDMVFWDNRSLLHLAAGCPPEQRRRMYRTTIEGDIPA